MTTTPPLDPVREKFEAFELTRSHKELIRLNNGNYASNQVHADWTMFQSAYASGHEAGKREERGRVVAIVRDMADPDAKFPTSHANSKDLIQRIEGAK